MKDSNMIWIPEKTNSGMTRSQIYSYIKENEYERVGPGIYVSPNDFADELLVMHLRCPGGVISHDEALYHYGLIDREPMSHTITVYSGYNASKLKRDGYKIYYTKKELLELGKVTVKDNYGNEIPIYDIDRTVVDMIRNRSSFEIQDFNTALKTYVKRPEKDLSKLGVYSKAFRVDKIVRNYMEVLL